MSEATDSYEYEVVVVGGGPADNGSTVQHATRSRHGCRQPRWRSRGHDAGGSQLLGVTEETSGQEFLGIGREQLEAYGGDLHRDVVESCSRPDTERIRLPANGAEYGADRVVLATGFSDVRPEPPLPRTGRGLHYCLTVTPTFSSTSRCT